ncbi:hypothetical protein CHARACLAT_031022 [Characodon lateralis]|uniref:Uncharacterized protein n=1 Tax=Characodon lateralis TaxID=208331 RepID=A0ABU7DLA5_9TELE|nr:hypothetical protein [Characodon lateralis]
MACDQCPWTQCFIWKSLTPWMTSKTLKEKLKLDDKKRKPMAQMVKIGGASICENMSNVMKRALTNRLMSGLNMDGGGGKGAFRKMTLCKVMIGKKNFCFCIIT